MRSARQTMSGGTLVAVGMVGMNVAMYAFTIVAARRLAPAEFGALTALLSVILVGNVASLGLQAVVARRISVAPDQRDAIVHATLRATALVAAGVGLLVAATTFVLTSELKLDSRWPIVLCGATLVPLTIMGAQAGVAQGMRRWGALTAIYAGNGLGRLVGGVLALAVDTSVTSAMIGIALGAWVPVIVGARLLVPSHADGPHGDRAALLREVRLSTHALLAYFVLSNLDALIARNQFSELESGLYASGLILTKAALFGPQFVSVVFFPDLAQAEGHGAKLRATAMVGAIGLVAVVATLVLPHVALILVGGDQYVQIQDRLWLFAMSGALLAVVHLLVFDALARHAHGVTAMLWVAVVTVVALAYSLDVHITGLVLIVAGTAATLAAAAWFAPAPARPHRER